MESTVAPSVAGKSARKVVLVHGYSAQGRDFSRWREVIQSDAFHVHIGDYVSLNNEITIKDIAEGFDRSLTKLLDGSEDFDAIVHSTGMLVVRAWLTVYPERAKRLKHLIALAPATNGSPLAHKGRGWLGAIFKGNRKIGPDFLEAGDRILEALELGSDFTWKLADRDLFGSHAVYGPTADTPYVFTFCGADDYGGLLGSFANEPGTDGTVRWAGCSLNSRKFTLDLTQPEVLRRASLHKTENIDDIPLIIVPKVNHSTIVSDPPDELKQLVLSALTVNSVETYKRWCEQAKARSAKIDEYQQFVLRVVDERGDPIPDYHIEIFAVDDGGRQPLRAFNNDVHPFTGDKSLRNFHVKLDESTRRAKRVSLRLTASSGTPLVQYIGFGDGVSTRIPANDTATPMAATEVDISFDTAFTVEAQLTSFFAPFTTTFVELRMNREPVQAVFSFLAPAGRERAAG